MLYGWWEHGEEDGSKLLNEMASAQLTEWDLMEWAGCKTKFTVISRVVLSFSCLTDPGWSVVGVFRSQQGANLQRKVMSMKRQRRAVTVETRDGTRSEHDREERERDGKAEGWDLADDEE